MKRKFKFLFILVPIALLTAATFTTMGLWNWLMPSLFGVGTLTFLKALGIFALARLFFGGRGWGGWRHRRMAYAFNQHGGWKNHMQARWEGMDAEQRAKFSSRCGWNPESTKTAE